MLLTYATLLRASTMEAMPRGPKAKRSARSPKLKRIQSAAKRFGVEIQESATSQRVP